MGKPDFDTLFAHLASGPQPTVGDVGRSVLPLCQELTKFDLIETAAATGGLLTVADLQSSCLRLETLAILAVRHCVGNRKPNRDFLDKAFRIIGDGSIGDLEDPAEDLFVSNIPSSRGNFGVLGGLREGAAFFLEVFLAVLDGMPDLPPYDNLKRSVYDLLRLSDALLDRRRLDRRNPGSDVCRTTLPQSLLSLGKLSAAVRFTNSELASLQINRDCLRRFGFWPSQKKTLDSAEFDRTGLQSHPLLFAENEVIVALPTSIASSIVMEIIETCHHLKMDESLACALALQYSIMLSDLPLLGGISGAPARFQTIRGIRIANFVRWVDAARSLHVVAILDNFSRDTAGCLARANSDQKILGEVIYLAVGHARSDITARENFREGQTLIVSCGWGRTIRFEAPPDDPAWPIKVVSIHDLDTLSRLPRMRPQNFWRTLSMVRRLGELGVYIHNANGLLNLFAHARSLGEHLVDHENLPEDFVDPDAESIIVVKQNGLRRLRFEVDKSTDRRRALDTSGKWIAIARAGLPLVPEGAVNPRYLAMEEVLAGRLRGAFLTPSRPWWIEVSARESREMQYRLLEMLLYWVGEAAPVLENTFANLPNGPINWQADFDFDIEPDLLNRPRLSSDQVDKFVQVSQVSSKSVRVSFNREFQRAFHQPDNFAEREIVAAFVGATGLLAGEQVPSDRAREIAEVIAPNPNGRHIHMFEARFFVQFVRSSIPDRYVTVTRQDDANFCLGVGWRVRSRAEGSTIEGKSPCMTYLNALVSELEREFVASLKSFARRTLIERALQNYQAISVDRFQGMSTASAVISLRQDRGQAMAKISEIEAERNAVSLASRIIVEAALSESPEVGTAEVGDMDLGSLMSLALGIFKYGGWSDAMRWDAMRPLIRISPLGDVLASPDFEDDVVLPFQKQYTKGRIEQAVEDYDKHYQLFEQPESIDTVFEPKFLSAVKAEIGCSLDDAFQILNSFDEMAIEKGISLLNRTRTELLQELVARKIPEDKAARFLTQFTMSPRATWRTVPEGYLSRDISPWRFRRRLSLLKLPIVNLSGRDDGEVVIAPDVVREGFIYQVRNFHEGDFDRIYPKSGEMTEWIGEVNNRTGHAFNAEVRERLGQLGWVTEAEVKITRLLRKGFGNKNYGDVDVLAWKPQDNRVVLLECKNLQFKKTFGEIGEQLSRFRGEIGADGKPDLLRKHLDRFLICREHLSAVASFTNIANPRLEAHLVFRNPVPMRYAWQELKDRAGLHLFRDLANL